MRTFTFSSEDRQWLMTWVLSVSLLVILMTSYERFLQARGFTPSVDVTADLWSWQRAQLHQPEVIALLGASRIQLAIDPGVLSEQLNGRPVVPLPVSGQYPLRTLQSLAADEQFTGTVIVSFVAQMLEPQYAGMQAAFNQNHEQGVGVVRHWNARFKAWLQSEWRFLHPLLRWPDLLPYLWQNHRFPDAFYLSIHADTTASADFTKVNNEILRNRFLKDKQLNYQQNPPMDDDRWSTAITAMAEHIRAIENRGGAVVVIRFPVGPGHWRLDEHYYPRERYWDVLQKQVPELKGLHLMDEGVFTSHRFPDSSHLDQRDKPAFTQDLAQLLKSRWPAVFTEPAGLD